jgi:hypothetical protein
MRSLLFAAEQVTHTIAILEVFDRVWQALTPAERHELILALVERVVVNVVAGSVEIAFHHISGPFDTDLGAEHVSGVSVAAPAGPDEPAPREAPLPWLAGRAAPTAAQEAKPCVLAPKFSPSAPRPPSASRRCPTAAPGTTPRPTSGRRGQLAERHAATVAKRLALAHHIAAQIDAGVYDDQADVARQHGLTRARRTQRMNLLLRAPDIQEEILALDVPAGRQPLSERTLRRLTESLLWADQRVMWRALRTGT